MKTGQTVDELGFYATECCGSELVFDMGDTFGPCPDCHAPCEWQLKDELITTTDSERDGLEG